MTSPAISIIDRDDIEGTSMFADADADALAYLQRQAANIMEPEPPAPSLTLLDLPDLVLSALLNGDALTNGDRANVACACRRLEAAVEFRHVVLLSRLQHLEAALRGGRCETLNAVGDDGVVVEEVHATVLARVGEAHPELVARLRVARVWWSGADAPSLPPALFPSLRTVLVTAASTVFDPPAWSDPRVVHIEARLSGIDGEACQRVARMPRPPLRLVIHFGHPIEDVERAHDAGLRVDEVVVVRVIERGDMSVYSEDYATRFAAAVAPIATRSFHWHAHASLGMLPHVGNAVRELTLRTGVGTFVALEALWARRASAKSSLALTMLPGVGSYFSESDEAALERLVAGNAIAKLTWQHLPHGVHKWTWILRAASPGLRVVDVGTVTIEGAIDLFSAVVPRVEELRMHLTFDSGNTFVERVRALGARLSQARHLRRVRLMRSIGSDAFRAFVDELTLPKEQRVERVDMSGHVSWIRA